MAKQSPAGKGKTEKKSPVTIILVVVMLVGLAIMAYPSVSDWWNSFHASRAIESYSQTVDSTDTRELEEMLQAAREYNQSLGYKDNPYRMEKAELERYNSLLNISGSGLIGYIRIPSINVNVPVYHGTEESILQVAAGHLDWTALPVGGVGTHCVVSGHRGLPSARLFTDLDKLREGDRFTVTVLSQTLTYEVDKIRIVTPNETDDLLPQSGMDLCTLLTCTPLGINSHRMLVRGHRVENEAPPLVITPDAVTLPRYLTVPAVGIPLLFIILSAVMIYTGRKKKRRVSIDYQSFKAQLEEQEKGGREHEEKE